MLEFTQMTINDKPIFDKFKEKYGTTVSEVVFTNLFMWRNHYNIELCVKDDMLFILSTGSSLSPPFMFMPIGDISAPKLGQAISELSEYFSQKNWKLKFQRVSEKQLPLFNEIGLEKIEIIEDPANYDYIYLTEDLEHLMGKKFHDKRNHINHFLRHYSYEYVPITLDKLETAKDVVRKQFAEDPEGSPEKNAYLDLFANYEKLGCKGAFIQIDGEYEAITVGEMMNDDMAVIHIEKANRDMQGLYAVTNQQFCKNEWSSSVYINREQDLGLAGLKKAKMSYNPVNILKKYTVNIG